MVQHSKKRFGSLTNTLGAEVSLFAKSLSSGRELSIDGDRLVRTASTIKVPIMVGTFASVRAGQASWDEPLTLTKLKQVGGSGVLNDLTPGMRLSLRDAVTLMIIVSDNTATNMVLERLGRESINSTILR
jgi:beta-lactamase class A